MAKDVETYIKEMQEISEKLNGGDLKLGEAVELYKKGAALAQKAEKLLSQYEKELEIIEDGESGV